MSLWGFLRCFWTALVRNRSLVFAAVVAFASERPLVWALRKLNRIQSHWEPFKKFTSQVLCHEHLTAAKTSASWALLSSCRTDGFYFKRQWTSQSWHWEEGPSLSPFLSVPPPTHRNIKGKAAREVRDPAAGTSGKVAVGQSVTRI